jgi:Tol biopolymer transport system component
LTFGVWSDVDAAFDPFGRSIAFASNRQGTYDIWVVNVDGRHLRQLTRLSGDERRPVWSSDGKKLAFVTQDESKGSLWVVDADDKDPRCLSTHTQIGLVEWQRRGRMIAYEALDNGQWSIWIARDDGTLDARLACNVHDCRYPSWGPNASTLFYLAQSDKTSDIRMKDLNKEDRSVKLIEGKVSALSVNPAGDYVAFVSDFRRQVMPDEGGEWGIWAVSVSSKTPNPFPIITFVFQGFSAAPDLKPKWTADGKNVMSIGYFFGNHWRPDLTLVVFRSSDAQGSFGGTIPAFNTITNVRGYVSSFSPSPINDNLVYTLGGYDAHLWIVLLAKPVSPYGS